MLKQKLNDGAASLLGTYNERLLFSFVLNFFCCFACYLLTFLILFSPLTSRFLLVLFTFSASSCSESATEVVFTCSGIALYWQSLLC